MGRTFRPPPGCRRFPGALPQAVTGPRRRRSDRPAHGPPWAPSALRLQRLLRFFAANFPNPFTADYADSADKKSASVLSVPSCKNPSSVRLSPASSVSALCGLCDTIRLRLLAPLALLCGRFPVVKNRPFHRVHREPNRVSQSKPRAERPAHPCHPCHQPRAERTAHLADQSVVHPRLKPDRSIGRPQATSTSGCRRAMSKSRSAAPVGWRRPRSQLAAVTVGMFIMAAKTG